jgi:hypothetical protein
MLTITTYAMHLYATALWIIGVLTGNAALINTAIQLLQAYPG